MVTMTGMINSIPFLCTVSVEAQMLTYVYYIYVYDYTYYVLSTYISYIYVSYI
jgi:hypothetical protein